MPCLSGNRLIAFLNQALKIQFLQAFVPASYLDDVAGRRVARFAAAVPPPLDVVHRGVRRDAAGHVNRLVVNKVSYRSAGTHGLVCDRYVN